MPSPFSAAGSSCAGASATAPRVADSSAAHFPLSRDAARPPTLPSFCFPGLPFLWTARSRAFLRLTAWHLHQNSPRTLIFHIWHAGVSIVRVSSSSLHLHPCLSILPLPDRLDLLRTSWAAEACTCACGGVCIGDSNPALCGWSDPPMRSAGVGYAYMSRAVLGRTSAVMCCTIGPFCVGACESADRGELPAS